MKSIVDVCAIAFARKHKEEKSFVDTQNERNEK